MFGKLPDFPATGDCRFIEHGYTQLGATGMAVADFALFVVKSGKNGYRMVNTVGAEIQNGIQTRVEITIVRQVGLHRIGKTDGFPEDIAVGFIKKTGVEQHAQQPLGILQVEAYHGLRLTRNRRTEEQETEEEDEFFHKKHGNSG